MHFGFFTVPIQNAEQGEAELNRVPAHDHRVLSIDRRWVEQGSTSFWAFCVDYLDSQAIGTGSDRGARNRVDYKEVLSPEEFTLFAKLRDARKELALRPKQCPFTPFSRMSSWRRW